MNELLIVQSGVFPAGGSWTVDDLPGLVANWDCSDTGSITGSPNVTQLDDLSGNGNHLLGQGTPVTGSVTIGGLNAIQTSGAGDGLYRAASISMAAVRSVFIVARVPSLAATQSLIQNLADGTYSLGCGTLVTSGAAFLEVSGHALDTGSAVTAAQAFQATFIANGASSIIRVDGSETVVDLTGSNYPGTAGPIIQFYNLWDAAVDLGQMFWSSQVIGGTDLTDAEAFLQTKWGTP